MEKSKVPLFGMLLTKCYFFIMELYTMNTLGLDILLLTIIISALRPVVVSLRHMY